MGSLLPLCAAGSEAVPGEASPWYGIAENGQSTVHLYFFWTSTCPHCKRARPFVESLQSRHAWLRIHSHLLQGHRENIDLYLRLARRVGQEARSVPAFIFCNQMYTGYDSPESVGVFLEGRLQQCHRTLRAPRTAPDERRTYAGPPVKVPLVGAVDPATLSLPVLTFVIAAMDAFNPCAFFVLLFLLSLLVHAHSRRRMLFIGGIFVFFSGLFYFVFMGAWLNVFLLMGELRVVTWIAGGVAVALAAINIKDYFWFRSGVSLSIPERAKPRLFDKMRRLSTTGNMTAMLVGTVALAAAANTYELLCTAGFPMVYTRILTLHELSEPTYYLYLVGYNAVYIVPLALIVVGFTLTLGSRKLTEKEGRILKLMSGLMMLGLGSTLLVAPQLLSSVVVAGALLALSLIGTFAIVAGERWWLGRPGHRSDASGTR